jgi:hypothetical protein
MEEEFIFLTIIMLHITAIEMFRTGMSWTESSRTERSKNKNSIEENHNLTPFLGVGYDN